MSKSVRIRDHLYEEIERLAKTERRSLIAQLEVLLEQALQLPENFEKPKEGPTTKEPREEIEVLPDRTEAVLTERGESGEDKPRSVSPASGKDRDVDAEWLRRRAGGKK